LTLALIVIAIFALILSSTPFVLGRGDFWDGLDAVVLARLEDLRSDTLTSVARALNALTDAWVLRVLRWGAVIGLLFFKRWRHLFAFAALILTLQPMLFFLANRVSRPRPDGIEILGPWSEFAAPSLPIAALAMTLAGISYALVVRGNTRRAALIASAAIVALVGLARIYLAVDQTTDVVSGAVLATTATLLVFRFWVPDAVFPVTYSKGKTAHLDLTELRTAAILTALRDQLGLQPVEVKAFGLEASSASTPLLISLEGDDPDRIFAKLYAQNHLRSDRWYKLGRSLLYGALEDERPFRSVRAMAQHEDYIMRLMELAGVPGPVSYGIVEITQGREYLLVTDFIEGTEISVAAVDETVVDQGLAAVRSMWDAGLAHRDIKPGNVLVRDSDIFLIDAAFGETRPTPWRQAVDLANMMLTLSLRTTPQQVYDAALKQFTDADIAEAFAATGGVTVSSELNRAIKDDPRDLMGELRELAPRRPPIRVQRWTRRRVALLTVSVLLAVFTAWLVVVNVSLVGRLL
jgi:tRNA A-37 threonylcarbamoyl transferase component Bud32/membrane-associated phospholipid phosphatase